MNRILILCLVVLAPFFGQGQITLSMDTLELSPTTIDSTTTAEITLSNSLVVNQEVAFTGIQLPFSIAPNPLIVPAEGSASATVSFNPTSVALFSSDVIAVGNAFGSDTIHIKAEGTLPGVSLITDTVDFGPTSINSEATAFVEIASTGLGPLFIGSITSDSPLLYSEGGITIESGDTTLIPIHFYSEFSGVYEINLTISTSDPFNPTVNVVCLISAISEVSGEVCGNWSIVNSPYQLTNNLIIPEGCSLTIDPGVVVLGDTNQIEVFGELHALGSEELPILMDIESIISHVDADRCTFLHCSVTERADTYSENFVQETSLELAANLFDKSLEDYIESFVTNDQNPLWYYQPWLFHLGPWNESNQDTLIAGAPYIENGDDNNWQGWSGGGSYDGGYGHGYYYNCCSWHDRYVYSPKFYFSPEVGEAPTSISFTLQIGGYYSCDHQFYLYQKVNGGGWTEILSTSCNQTQDYTVDLESNVEISQLEFRFRHRFNRGGSSKYDNVVLNYDSPIAGLEQPSSEIIAFTNSHGFQPPYQYESNYEFVSQGLNTGGFTLDSTSWSGGLHIWSDSTEIILHNSEVIAPQDNAELNHGIWVEGDHTSLHLSNSTVEGHTLSGLHLQGGSCSFQAESSSIADNGQHGLHITNSGLLDMDSIDVSDNGQNGILVEGIGDGNANAVQIRDNGSNGLTFQGSNSSLFLYQSDFEMNGGSAIALSGSDGDLQADYSFITENGGHGVLMGYNSELRMDNSLIAYNSGNGIVTDGAVDLNYMNVLHNGGAGIHTNQFSTVNNSIVWFNGGVPQMTTYNTYAASYTNVQGINALLTSTEFAWGDGCIGTDPVLADSLGHLDPFSPCVDGGMPWEQDAHIPYGLGSSRADMGMYGGPANAYWGGQAPPDGAVVITDLFDIPQDQGGVLGLHFTASPFDFGGLGFNVTHYSIWRDLALGSDAPTIVGDGNWEQIGTVPAQGFSQYGYTAATLVDAAPGDSTCLSSFIVIAHTTDDNIYWVSDVAAACSYDNLAPEAPELDGDVLLDETGGATVVVSWPAPEEDDYAYTVIERADGVSANVVGDTLLLDADVMPGSTYDYLGYHLDMNGNPSDTAYVSVTVVSDRDEIALAPGWNLISLDRTPLDASVAAVMASLLPGNLQYVIGFDQGVTLYDPAGLPFLNSLETVEDGYGYWVKVAEADTLTVEGPLLPSGYLPALDAGWNLIAYTPVPPAVPGQFFADLIAEGALEYVTGFDGGVQVYDPDGLPFLNSLTALQNGFGYWVKTSLDGPGMEVVGGRTANPAFDVLSGVADVAGGTVIEVMAGDLVVGVIDVVDGGLLMPTAVFGDDPSTDAVEGIAPGTEVQFVCDGRVASESLVWEGSMALPRLALTFGASYLQVSPNPSPGPVLVSFDCERDAQVTVTLCDLSGRQLEVLLDAERPAGADQIQWDARGMAAGTYLVRLSLDGVERETARLILH